MLNTNTCKYRRGTLPYLARTILTSTLVGLLGLVAPTQTRADDNAEPDTAKVLQSRFALGIAASVNRFDTSYKIADKSTGRSIFIDGEGSLNLPETDVSPLLYGYWRINQKHGVGFRYFGADREGSSIAFDEPIGNVNVTGNLTVFDRSSFYLLNYGYTFSTKPDSLVRGIIGLYGLDLRLGFKAEGQITQDGQPPKTGIVQDETNTFVPLPLVGVDFWQAISKDWALGARFSMIGGKFDDTDGLVFDAAIRARYQISNHVGLVLAANYFSGDINISDNNKKTEIKYGYDGFAIGLDFNW